MIIYILIILLILIPFVLYKKRKDDIRLSCGLNSVNTIRGDGYIIANNILDERCRNNLVNTFLDEMRQNKNLNEDRNLQFYSNEQFLNELSALVGEKLYPVNSLDLQRCWLRYYFEGMKAQYYENYHHDTKRYRSDITHYRLIIPIYDTSNSVFSIENYGSFPFKENMGVFVETGNCLHKVKFTTGERLLLFMDFTNKPCDSLGNHYTCRGINGYMYWIKDSIWRKFSETYYKLVN